jgi:hypothetical protein
MNATAPRRRTLLRTAALLGLAVATASCGESVTETGRTVMLTSLSAAEQRWHDAGLRSYRMDVLRVCQCLRVAGPARVEVADGVVTARTQVQTGLQVPDAIRPSYPGVEGLFDVIRESIDRKPARLSVLYHPQYGYPVEAFIDFDRSTSADNLRIEITEFIISR